MAANTAFSNTIAAPYAGASPNYTPSLGTNFDNLSYYSTALPTLDLMKSASAWLPQNSFTFNTFEKLDLDSSGWVKTIPAAGGSSAYDRVGITLLANNAAAPSDAHYVVLYTGEGTLTGSLGTTVIQSESTPGHMVIQAADDGSLNLQILSTDPNHTGNYLRDIHVVREDDLGLYNAGLNINPAFLAKVDDFGTFRFMEWMETNKVFDSSGNSYGYDPVNGFANVGNAGQLNWADRPKMTDAQWNHGVPVEAMVEAANEAGTDVWFNMPINASDDYVTNFAIYVRDHLRPDLKIHVEFSNEVWNFSYPQSAYAIAQAKAQFGSADVFGDNGNFFEWYGMRTAQVGMIWKNIFGQPATSHDPNNRVSVVLNTQAGNMGAEQFALQTRDWYDANGNHISAGNYFDEYAIAGYYGDVLSSPSNTATVKSWLTQSDGGFTSAIAAMQEQITDVNAPMYAYHEKAAAAYGLRLVAYEAGYGAVAPVAVNSDTALTDFYTELARDPRTYALEQQNYAAFEAAGGTLYTNYKSIASSSQHGSYGVLESVTQDSSPRYDALVNINETATPVLGAGQTATTFQNARFYTAGDGGEVIAGTLHGYDVLAGGAGNDVFVLYGSGSQVDGGTGFDSVVVPGAISNYTFTQQPDGSTVVTGNGESWTLRNIDQVIANDGSKVLIGNGAAGVAVTSVVASGAGLTAGSGVLGVGSVVKLTVNLSGAVTVSGGVPTLDLNDGGTATYSSGSGTSALTFLYTIGANQNTADLGVVGVHLNNATLMTQLPTTAIGTGPTPNLTGAAVNPDGTLQVDTVVTPLVPVVTSVSASGAGIASGSGIVGVGTVVTLTVNLSKAVTVSGGVPTLDLNDGGVATYVSGSGTNALTFNYTVAAGESTPDLTVVGFHLNDAIVRATAQIITSGSNQTLTDANGHVFSFGAVYQGTDRFILRDGLPGGAGTELVLVNGVVYNYNSLYGWYADNNGTFVYQQNAPALDTGHAADLSASVSNPVGVLKVDTSFVPSVPSNPGTPYVTSVIASGAGVTGGFGLLGVGAVVTLTVNMSQTVNVSGGVPTLDLNNGGTATYAGGSGTSALQFTYTVAAGQNTTDLTVTGFHANNAAISTGSPTISSNAGGSLTDANGHVFTFGAVYQGTDHIILRDGLTDGFGTTLSLVNGTIYNHTANYGWYQDNNGSFAYVANAPTIVAGSTADFTNVASNPVGVLQIDTTSTSTPTTPTQPTGPVVTSVAVTGTGITSGSGILGVGAVVTLTVNMSQAVNVSGGIPTLDLNDGGTATYVSGSGTNALKFTYTVAAGQNTTDLTVTGFHANNATIATGTPTITSDTGGSLTDANGHVFTFGAVYQGTDHIILRDGLTEGFGTSLALVNGTIYNHTANFGWYLDNNGSFSYAANAPTIATGTVADLTNATTNPVGILRIDTSSAPVTPTPSGPTVTSVVASGAGITNGAGVLGIGSVVTLTLNMSQAVNVVGGVPTLDLNDGGTATYAGGSGSNALSFTYTVAAGQSTGDLTVTGFHANNATISTGTPTISGDTGGSLTDANGHVFTFGAVYQGTDHIILRDGLTEGFGTSLALVNGTIYNHTANYGWYSDHNGSFSYEANAPTLSAGLSADLTNAATNPAGILQIDTTSTPVTPAPTGPTVVSVITSGTGVTNGAGVLGVGAVVTLTLNMSDTVNVSGGVPTLDLNDGGTATYASGSGSNALKFTYTVAAGQNTADLTVIGFHANNVTVSTGTPTITSDGNGSLTDANGHVFAFGAVYQGTDHIILRDGFTDGFGSTLVLVNGTIYNHTANYGWYSDHGGSFSYEANAPAVTAGHAADLSGAVTNPAGTLQIDTTHMLNV